MQFCSKTLYNIFYIKCLLINALFHTLAKLKTDYIVVLRVCRAYLFTTFIIKYTGHIYNLLFFFSSVENDWSSWLGLITLVLRKKNSLITSPSSYAFLYFTSCRIKNKNPINYSWIDKYCDISKIDIVKIILKII